MSDGIQIFRSDLNQAVSRLAQLDSQRAPTGPVLAAEVNGELRAALPLDGGGAVADPFHHTAELVSLLEVRRAQMRGTVRRAHRLGGLRLALRRPDQATP